MRMVEVNDVEALRFEPFAQRPGVPAVAAVAGGQPGGEAGGLLDERIDRGRPPDQLHATFEEPLERSAVLAFAPPGEDTELEVLIERAEHAQGAERAAPVGGKRKAWQEAQDSRPPAHAAATPAKRFSRALVMAAVVYRCR